MTGRRRWWQWAVAAWLILVAAAGGLTLWWQDPADPQRYSWQETSPTPSLPSGWESMCAGATPDEEGRVLCFVRTR